MSIYIFYYILLILQAALLSLNSNINRLYKKIILFLGCIEIIILMGLRHCSVGADTFAYISALYDYSEYDFTTLLKMGSVFPYKFEFGYLWLTKICAFFHLDYNLFLIIIASLIYIPTYKLIYRFSPFPILSISIYFGLGLFSYSIGIFRQFIAISIIVSGIDYIINRELAKWCFVVIFATLFHTSALICVPMYLLCGRESKWFLILGILAQPILHIYGRTLLEYIFSHMSIYSGYINSAYDVVGGSFKILFFYNIILIITILYNRFFRKDNSKYISFYCNCVPIVCCLQVLGSYLGIFGRIVPFYSIFIIILIPCMIKDVFEDKAAYIVANCLNVAFFILFVIRTTYDEYIMPFLFFWDK